ncbi:MAG: hypothetical protein IPQ10_04730 [Saprospiraceae bacterium]|jgi:hypothetical protein|nr:hypothetical protein [Saprospiraceae bacterium]MBK7796239.1 hypothetical protein [Saprospiraceae bacterium]MBL0260367.1 hypothetical protein [Saprospiraceae bacterium]
MNHVTGIPRLQMQMSSLEDSIGQDNPVRFIDAFVEQLDLLKLGFEVKTVSVRWMPM